MLYFKKLWKYFLIVFLAAFLVINWNEISWLFNYKFVWQSLPTLQILKDIEKSGYASSDGTPFFADQKNSIDIPKINVFAPLVFAETQSQRVYQSALQNGVLHYPQSALPGKGTSIILGHSAPPNWPKLNYDWVFNDLYKLEPGDRILVYFDQRQYTFEVIERNFVKKGAKIPEFLTNDKPALILLSCWPPGRDEQRIVIFAQLTP